ncbi:cupredoxin domain-containing protein [Methanobacterium sp.]|uniref:cupredoxin domain-containing protein n=1 Tax=Methanobacterium sp. TaxID=2164 RepID=UPI003C75415C
MNVNFIGIGIILLIVGVIAFSGCTQNPEVTNTVIIQNSTFSPNPIHLEAGTEVTWINQDNASHKIVSDTGDFESPTLNKGDSFNHAFYDDGEYNYHDGINPSMKGKVIVQNRTTG